MQAPIAEWTKAPTIIFFHGNAGNIGLRLPNALQMLQYLNVNVLLVEYRGTHGEWIKVGRGGRLAICTRAREY
jgi:hypothetical protein